MVFVINQCVTGTVEIIERNIFCSVYVLHLILNREFLGLSPSAISGKRIFPQNALVDCPAFWIFAVITDKG